MQGFWPRAKPWSGRTNIFVLFLMEEGANKKYNLKSQKITLDDKKFSQLFLAQNIIIKTSLFWLRILKQNT